jgi:hypothetical protein
VQVTLLTKASDQHSGVELVLFLCHDRLLNLSEA